MDLFIFIYPLVSFGVLIAWPPNLGKPNTSNYDVVSHGCKAARLGEANLAPAQSNLFAVLCQGITGDTATELNLSDVSVHCKSP
jgi:hypothetical protein